MADLTVSVHDLQGEDLSGVKVEAVLQAEQGESTIVLSDDGDAIDWQRPVSAETDASGEATLSLVPSSELPTGFTYSVTIYGQRGTYRASGLTMPDSDSTLEDLLSED